MLIKIESEHFDGWLAFEYGGKAMTVGGCGCCGIQSNTAIILFCLNSFYIYVIQKF